MALQQKEKAKVPGPEINPKFYPIIMAIAGLVFVGCFVFLLWNAIAGLIMMAVGLVVAVVAGIVGLVMSRSSRDKPKEPA